MAERSLEPMAYRTLSVIVPVYNERTTVAEIVRRVRAVDVPLVVDVVVVDDGSTDGTDKVLAAIEDSTVRVVTHERNQGKGAAIRTGLAHARGDLVLVQDADLEYDPERLAPAARPGAQAQGQRGLRQPVHRRAQEHDAAALDRQPVPLAGHQRPLLLHAVGHGDLLQAVRPPGARRRHRRVQPVRLRARDHRQGAPPRLPHLRGAHLLRRAGGRRGEEDHLAGRVRGA